MRTLPMITCVSALSLLAACGSPDYDHYDANGNYIGRPSSTEAQRIHAPDPGRAARDSYYRSHRHNPDRYNDDGVVARTTVTTYNYDRPGYYDYKGYYIGRESSFNVARNMFPPRGMCRVWFPERIAADQPDIESCDGIRMRVPAGAYVIYGG